MRKRLLTILLTALVVGAVVWLLKPQTAAPRTTPECTTILVDNPDAQAGRRTVRIAVRQRSAPGYQFDGTKDTVFLLVDADGKTIAEYIGAPESPAVTANR